MHTYSIELSPVGGRLGLGWSSPDCGQGVPSFGTGGSEMRGSSRLGKTCRQPAIKITDSLNSLDIQAFSADGTPEKTIEGSLPMN